MNELNVTIEQQAILSNNLEAIKAELTEKMSFYDGLVIKEDDIPVAKKDLAEIRKIKKSVDDSRKEVKKAYMKPYEDFEKQVKEVLAIIDKPIALIDGQLKEFEAKRIAEKQEHLKQLYTDGIGEYADFLPYEKVARPQWDNVSYTDKAIMADISEQVAQLKIDLSTIQALQSEIEDQLLGIYKLSGLAAAIQKNTDYLNTKKLAEERVKREAEEQARKESEEKAKQAEQAIKEEIKEPEIVPETEDEIAIFEVHGKEDIAAVRSFMFENDIDYSER